MQSDLKLKKRESEREKKKEIERQTYVNPSTDRGVISDPNHFKYSLTLILTGGHKLP